MKVSGMSIVFLSPYLLVLHSLAACELPDGKHHVFGHLGFSKILHLPQKRHAVNI